MWIHIERRKIKPKNCMGMTIDKWGPCAWNTLHAFAHRSPLSFEGDEDEEWKTFLTQFATSLPCPRCKEHFMSFLESHKTRRFRGRQDLVSFLNDAHNDVNTRLGKRTFTLEEHISAYSIAPTHNPIFSVHILHVVIVVFLILYFLKRKKSAKV